MSWADHANATPTTSASPLKSMFASQTLLKASRRRKVVLHSSRSLCILPVPLHAYYSKIMVLNPGNQQRVKRVRTRRSHEQVQNIINIDVHIIHDIVSNTLC